MHKTILIFILLTTYTSINAQTYRNMEWVKNYGSPDSIEWSATATDVYWNLITIGNTKVSGEKTNMLITKFDNGGSIIWQKDWNGPQNGFDYGADIICDNWGNIYAVGASHYSSDSTFDITVLKYDVYGNQIWQSNYDNEGKDDYPVKMTNDIFGNIYITGSTESATTGFDFITLKIDTSGTLVWDTRYDFNNHVDIAGDIISDGLGTVITVTGGSEDSIGIWDYTTITYDDDGYQININREAASGSGIKKPRDIVKDIYGNYYITGIYNNGIDNDLKIIKLDSTLAPVWVSVYDNSSGGTNEEANSLAMDDSGYLYIGGWQQLVGAEERRFLVLKYAQNGSLVWEQTLWPNENKPLAEITNLMIKNGNVNGVGFCTDGITSDIVTVRYNDDNGSLGFVETWENKKSSINFPSDIKQIGQDIFVTGRTTDSGQVRWAVVKYTLFVRDTSVFRDTLGKALFAKNELIVRFEHEAIKADAINNTPYRETEWGDLNTFLKEPEAAIVQAKLKQAYNYESGEVKVYKIFRELFTYDTTTISRLGETIPIPKFWATFILSFPDGSNISKIADSLNALFPLVKYVHPNVLISLDSPNDSMFSDQLSLHPAVSNDSVSINIEPAWAITEAKPYIRVGIIDDGLQFKHKDFGYDGNNIKSSSVVGGWDFEDKTALVNSSWFGNHGTPVGGIIGAVKNNGKGIAGIAGRNDSVSHTGVSLFGLQIFKNNYFSNPLNYVAEAIMTSSIYDSNNNPAKAYRYGLHITNNSWKIKEFWDYFTDTNITLLSEAVHFSNRIKVTFVASRGNDSNVLNQYPAIYDDNWVLCVGGTGLNGSYKGIHNGDPGPFPWAASYGPEIDVSAPAVLSLVKTLGSVNNYIAFNGTSVSAPHVAGVAALLMSYLNDSVPSANNLALEDVEHIIQATATDVGASGYDIYTGYGRLNAGAALNFVNKDKRRIIHPNNDNPIFIDYTLKSLYASNQTISIAERYENKAEVWFKPGKYKADVYKITADISHSEKMGPYDSIIDAWARHSSSNLLAIYGAGNKLVPHERIYLDTVHFNYVEISGYIYRISDTVGNFMGWWPFDTSLSQVKLAYSVLIKNNYKPPVNVTKIVPTAKGVFVYPNPGNMQQTIKIQSTNPQSLNIELFDVSGRLIKLVFNGKVGVGEHTYSVDVSSISDGIYFYRISLGNSLFHSKTIKQ